MKDFIKEEWRWALGSMAFAGLAYCWFSAIATLPFGNAILVFFGPVAIAGSGIACVATIQWAREDKKKKDA